MRDGGPTGRRRRPTRRWGWWLPGTSLLALLLAGGGVMTSAAFTGRTVNSGNSLAALATFPTYPQAVAADSPQSYYRADDPTGSLTAADSSGHANTGNYIGASGFQQPGSPAGGSGAGADTATQFPGLAGTGAYSTASMTNPAAITVEVWFKTSTTTGGKLIGLGNLQTGSSNTYDRHIWMSNDGKLHSGCYTGTAKIVDSTAAYNDNAWHLVTASFGAAGMALYVDGVSVGTQPATTTCQNFTGYWRLGGDSMGSWTPTPSSAYFSGRLDEAVVFTTQLSSTRVAAHYAAGTGAGTPAAWTSAVTADAPWALWHLDDPAPTAGNSTTSMADSSGSAHGGTYVGMAPTVTFGGTGALTGTQTPDASTRFAGAGWGYDPTARANPTTYSIEAWFRTSTTTGGKLIGFGNGTTAGSSSYDRHLYMTNAGRLDLGINPGSLKVITSPSAYNDGQWHHVVGTQGSAGLLLYVDGVLVASDASPGSPQNFTGYWHWGGDTMGTSWPGYPTSAYFTGDLDEIAIYTTQLSAQQVAWHFHANH